MKKFSIVKNNHELVGNGVIKETDPGVFRVDLICEGSDAHFSGLTSEKDASDRVMNHLFEVFARPNGESYGIRF